MSSQITPLFFISKNDSSNIEKRESVYTDDIVYNVDKFFKDKKRTIYSKMDENVKFRKIRKFSKNKSLLKKVVDRETLEVDSVIRESKKNNVGTVSKKKKIGENFESQKSDLFVSSDLFLLDDNLVLDDEFKEFKSVEEKDEEILDSKRNSHPSDPFLLPLPDNLKDLILSTEYNEPVYSKPVKEEYVYSGETPITITDEMKEKVSPEQIRKDQKELKRLRESTRLVDIKRAYPSLSNEELKDKIAENADKKARKLIGARNNKKRDARDLKKEKFDATKKMQLRYKEKNLNKSIGISDKHVTVHVKLNGDFSHKLSKAREDILIYELSKKAEPGKVRNIRKEIGKMNSKELFEKYKKIFPRVAEMRQARSARTLALSSGVKISTRADKDFNADHNIKKFVGAKVEAEKLFKLVPKNPSASRSIHPKKKREMQKITPAKTFSNKEIDDFKHREKKRINKEITNKINTKKLDKKLRREARNLVKNPVSESGEGESILFSQVFDFVYGYGPFTGMFKKLDALSSAFSKIVSTTTINALIMSYHLFRSRNFLDVSVAIGSFLHSCGLSGMKRACKTMLKMVRNWKFTEMTTFVSESWSDTIFDMRNFFASIYNSDMLNVIRKGFISAVMLQIVPEDMASTITKHCGKTDKPSSLMEALCTMLDSLGTIMKNIEKYQTGISIEEILLSDDPIKAWFRKYNDLVYYKDLLYRGQPVDGKKCYREFVFEAKQLILDGEILLKNISKFDTRKQSFDSAVKDLKKTVIQVLSENSGLIRKSPKALLITGPPSIGKSNIIQLIARIWCKIMGRKYHPGVMYSRPKTSEYWEGYDPLSQFIIFYSELCNESNAMAKLQGGALLTEFNSVVDCLPFNCNMAFLEKGKTLAQPELVMADSNNEGLHLTTLMHCPSAIERRFDVIRVSVKNEFRLPRSTAIDYKKSLADAEENGSHILDRYNFEYVVRIPEGNKSNEIIKSFDNLMDFVSFLEDEFKQHIFKQQVTTPENMYDFLYTQDSPDHSQYAHKPKRNDFDFIFNNKNIPNMDDEKSIVSESGDRIPDIIIEQNLDRFFRIRNELMEPLMYTMSVRRFNSDDPIRSKKFNRTRNYQKICPGKWGIKGSRINKYVPNSFPFPSIEDPEDLADEVEASRSTPGTFEIDEDTYQWLKNTPYREDWQAPTTGKAMRDALGSVVVENTISDAVDLFDLEIRRESATSTIAKSIAYLPAAAISSGIAIATKFLGKLDVLKNHRDKINKLNREACAYILDKEPTSQYGKFIEFGVILCGAALAAKLFWKTFFPAESDKLVSETNIMTDYDVKNGVCPPRARVKSKDGFVYNIAMGSDKPPPHKGSLETLFARCLKNTYLTRLHTLDSPNHTHIFGLCSSIALINTHAFRGVRDFNIDVSRSGDFSGNHFQTMRIRPQDIMDLGNDLSLINLSKIVFRDITKHLLETNSGVTEAHGVQGSFRISFLNKVDISDKTMGVYPLTNAIEYRAKHDQGYCGIPIVTRVGENSAGILAIHAAGDLDSDRCIGTTFLRKNILDSITLFKKGFPVPLAYSESFEEEMYLPNRKSPFVHEAFQNITYFGKLEGEVTFPKKSMMTRTTYGPDMLKFFEDEFKYVQEVEYGPPLFAPKGRGESYISPFNNLLRKMDTPSNGLEYSDIRYAVDTLLGYVLPRLRDKGVTGLSPITIHQAINGVETDPYIQRMNASTAAGYPLKGKKSDHMPFIDDGPDRKMSPELAKLVYKIIANYGSELNSGSINDMFLKDEARPLPKIETGNTRGVNPSPQAKLIVDRTVLAPILSLMNEFCEIFKCGIGLNMRSAGGKLYDRLSSFSPYGFDGDYKQFDCSAHPDIGYATNLFFKEFAEAMGYNDHAMRILLGVLSDDAFPLQALNKDLFLKVFCIISGVYGTAEKNCIRNLLMAIIIWKRVAPQGWNFFDNVDPETYGDDILKAVKEEALSFYNAFTYRDKCKELFNMTFTPANKNGEISVPFTTIDQLSFLKRNFVISKLNGKWCTPLNLESIVKSLIWRLPSQVITYEKQAHATFQSGIWEVFMHCSDINQYYRCRKFFVDTLVRYFGGQESDYPMPNFEEIYEHCFGEVFLRTHQVDLCNRTVAPLEVFTSVQIPVLGSESTTSPPVMLLCGRIDDFRHARQMEKVKVHLSDLKMELKEVREALYKKQEEKDLPYTLAEYSLNPIFTNGYNETLCDQHRLLLRESELLASIRYLDNVLAKRNRLRSESSDGYDSPSPVRQSVSDIYGVEHARLQIKDLNNKIKQTNQNISKLRKKKQEFEQKRDNYEKYILTLLPPNYQSESAIEPHNDSISPTTETREENVIDVAGADPNFEDAGESYSWPFGQKEVLQLEDFFARPIEIANGVWAADDLLATSFKVWDLYTKDPQIRDKLQNYAYFRADLHIKIAFSGTPYLQGKVLGSYQPHNLRNLTLVNLLSSYVDTETVRPLLISYLSQAPGRCIIDVKDNRPVTIHIPFIHVKPMCRLFNSASTAITSSTSFADIQHLGTFFLYSTGVLRTVNSDAPNANYQIYCWATNVNLGVPTGTLISESDERKSGPLERTFTAASAMAGVLEDIYGIPPNAKASSFILGKSAEVSAWFGLCKPEIISPPSFMKERAFTNGCQAIGRETLEKLSLDPLQELPIGPQDLAVSHDDMSLASMYTRESFLTKFDWEYDTEIMTGSMFKCRVEPTLNTYRTNDVGFDHAMVQPTPMSFVASAFEYWTGSIVFRFEFLVSQFTRGKAAILWEPNVYQHELITADASLNKQFVALVDLQETSDVEICINWGQAEPWKRVQTADDESRTAYGATFDSSANCNGFIWVVPYTKLANPLDVPVEVNVYVKGKNLQFNLPSGQNMPAARHFVSESGTDSPVSCIELNPTTHSPIFNSTKYFGEEVKSWRTLLKRFSTTVAVNLTIESAESHFRTFTCPAIPKPWPLYGDYADVTVNNRFYLGYLRYAYMGIRGGARHRLRMNMQNDGRLTNCDIVKLMVPDDDDTITEGPLYNHYLPGIGGVAYNVSVNGGIEFEVPFYSNNLFHFSFANDFVGTSNVGDMYTHWVRKYDYMYYRYPQEGIVYSIYDDFAIGEDFCLMRFQGTPFYSYSLV